MMKSPETAFGAIYTERVGGSNSSPPTTSNYRFEITLIAALELKLWIWVSASAAAAASAKESMSSLGLPCALAMASSALLARLRCA